MLRDRYVMVKEGEVDPVHVPAAEGAMECAIGHIGSYIFIHALATEAQHQGAKVQIAQQSFADHPAQILQVVLVANFNDIRPFFTQDSAYGVLGIQVLCWVETTVTAIERGLVRAHSVDPAVAAHLFDPVFSTRDNEPHLPLLLVSHLEHGLVEGRDAARVGMECVGQVQGFDRHWLPSIRPAGEHWNFARDGSSAAVQRKRSPSTYAACA